MPLSLPIRLLKSKKTEARALITVVSGLPRSGTSMMMRMLETGGLPVLTDRQRTPDENNPRGYYEFERVKQLRAGDYAWLPEANGKAVKIISALLEHLPPHFTYRVIFMQRDLDEVVASQRKMLDRMGEDHGPAGDEKMKALFREHLLKVEAWLAQQPFLSTLYINYNDLLQEPSGQVERVGDFLGRELETEKMARVVDRNLYRERRQAV